MKIIGVGCGPGLLTEQAKKELKRARFAYGSDRAISPGTAQSDRLTITRNSLNCRTKQSSSRPAIPCLPVSAICGAK